MRLGTEEHEREHKRAKERRTVYGFAPEDVAHVLHNVYVETECGLYGQIDTLVTLTSGDIVPVEVKYSDRAAVSRQWKKQLVAYALLLRSLGHHVTCGLIYLPKSKKLVKVEILQEDLNEILSDVKRIRSLLRGERMPRGVREDKCVYCEVRKFCIK
jgi:CRISPR-associated exonuclease Cas4